MKKKYIPDEVLFACRERELSDSDIEGMSARDLFHEYCEWHGLINWSNTLYHIVVDLEAAAKL